MPLPTPKENEAKSEFVSRCISELTHANEFKSKAQRIAVCYAQWDKSNKEEEKDDDKQRSAS